MTSPVTMPAKMGLGIGRGKIGRERDSGRRERERRKDHVGAPRRERAFDALGG